jgi:hypothetical protein
MSLPRASLRLIQERRRPNDNEDGDREKERRRVENQKVLLMLIQRSVVSHGKFNDTVYRPDLTSRKEVRDEKNETGGRRERVCVYEYVCV